MSSPSLFFFGFLILVLTLLEASHAANPVKEPIQDGPVPIHTRFFAQIPNYRGEAARILAMVPFGNFTYVTTGASGGRIYRVSMQGRVSLWFNAGAAMQANGRPMNLERPRHGGIRGIAFHPAFNRNGLFYISAMEDRPSDPSRFSYFSRVRSSETPIDADSVVLEFRYSHREGRVLPDSYRSVIRIEMPHYDHPVKQIAFDRRNLLIGHGDGSVQSAITGGGQRNDGLGKVLRINPLRQGSRPYTIPSDNPFRNTDRWRDEIYAVGFRNPHNICVSRRHGIFVTDAGRDNVEEINIIRAGGNYGWSRREGTFVHRSTGGIVRGVGDLPSDDAKYGYIYPNVQVGHYGPWGEGWVGQALTGACPVENGSPLSNIVLYGNFPTDGQVYYSWVGAMKKAKVTGRPSTLTQATTLRAKVFFDHDRNSATAPRVVDNLRAVVRIDTNRNAERVDLRFGQGPRGEIYWSSKTNGRIYVITNSIPSRQS